ncbi:MAG: dual specificity protein phosphatase family protein [Planctomycetota bacterium]
MPVNFSFVLPERLAGMECPGSNTDLTKDLDFLASQKIGAVVSLTPRRLDEGALKARGFRWLHLPIEDFSSPSMEQIETFVQFVDERLAENRAVVVHCGVGYGRTGTMLACYLVHDGLDAEEAIWQIRLFRPRSIETAGQEATVRAYARHSGRDV